MLADPITITIDSNAKTLNRVQDVGSKPPYFRNEDGTLRLDVTHFQPGKGRNRHNVRFEQRKVVENPLSQKQDYDSVSILISFEQPDYGWTTDEVADLKTAIFAFLSDANLAKILGGQS